ncbi:hypothetical protein L202_02775 [Cryptococcus amylolentus CBS 6039]|uniref:Helicase SWR1 n=1 Tax=Cryptococcus amylolentus CBS 6039 TaxID=1295533 RepID=A0A1E3HW83_9TREE|nr:hypothetical protein L202_02775 [Cryptococcus amylolentus CBS 6039]ODN80583.1 hypothetical protein L202_02775 [Cryptococcus amylolentus CBS 6039]
MDVGTSASSAQESNLHSSNSAVANKLVPEVASAARSLRARPSSIDVPTPGSSIAPGAGRGLSKRNLDVISQSLNSTSIEARREQRILEKEAELKDVVEEHDSAIREKFHLERFVTLLEGWDPEQAKLDNSQVFLEWKESKHNLLSLLPSQPAINGASRAGPSRPRTSLPARTTRRKAHEQSEILANVVTPAPVAVTPSAKGKEKAVEPKSGDSSPVKAGKTGRGKAVNANGDMPPPPLPKGRRASRRVTMGASVEPEPEEDVEVEEPVSKGKRRGRMSLPDLPAAKKLKNGRNGVPASESASPAVETPTSERPSPSPFTPALPSLAHLPFPPPPQRPRKRLVRPRKVQYTEPSQIPPPPQYNGDISQILKSYIHINDTGAQPDLKSLESRAKKDGYLLARVTYLQRHGRLQRLLDEGVVAGPSASHAKIIRAPARQTDHHDSLLVHMVQVRNAILNQAKAKPVVCKKIAKMVQTYWERIEGREERERLAEEKERKRLMKETMKGLRKRWALAVKIIRAKFLEEQKQEQDRLGKVHLQNMLQRSTGLLESQVRGPEDEVSDESEEESYATDEVSAAEDSEEDEDGDRSDPESSMPPTSIPPESEMADHSGDDGEDQEEEDDMDTEVASEGHLHPFVSENAMATDDAVDALVDHSEEMTLPSSLGANQDRTESVALQSPNGGPTTADDAPVVNGLSSSASPPVTRRPSRRVRKSVLPLPSDPDPDANDVDFNVSTSDIDDQDAELDVEMEDGEDVDRNQGPDSEDEGLLADADIPIEELLKRYGYPAPAAAQAEEETASEPIKDDVENTIGEPKAETQVSQEAPNGTEPSEPTSLVETHDGTASTPPQVGQADRDQSLTDATLSASLDQTTSDSKRQRRKRELWSPDDVGPQRLSSGKRKKVELIVEDGTISTERLAEDVPEAVAGEDSEEESEEGSEEESEEESEEDSEEDEEEEEPKEPEINEHGAARITPPFLLRGTLRPYQQAGLEWLASLWENSMNGILADEMGLGKTIQTIALLGHLACSKGVWGQHLIIVPTSVILNWEMEFKKFLPGLKVLTYYGNQKERKEKRVGWNTENAWQVCITSYQIVLADQHIFRRKSWCYMILDEAHNIKNFRSQRWQTLLGFKAKKRLLLTGTPLQNNLMELWSLLYFLMPGGIGEDATSVVGFANHKDFMEWFSNPMDKAIETGEAMDEETLETVAKLHTLLRPFILRRLKSEVETQLPGKFEHVVYCRLSKRQRFLYDEFMARASTREALTSGGYLGVMNTLMQLRKVCNHPDLFEVRPVRTSFAMESVVKGYEPSDILVRKRLLKEEDDRRVDVLALGFNVTHREDTSPWVAQTRQKLDASDLLPYAMTPVKRGKPSIPPVKDTRTVEGWLKYQAWVKEEASQKRWESIRHINRQRCAEKPLYGNTFLQMLGNLPNFLIPSEYRIRREDTFADLTPPAANLIASLPQRAEALEPIIDRFAVIPPNAVARDLTTYALPGIEPISHPSLTDPSFDTLHRSTVKLQIAFPDASLLQFDCGKLQKLWEMLRDLKAGGHRVLIFTQMTRVLDILEMFLSYNGHRYLRLDGSTKIEDRQVLTERFNTDPRVFVFIASSRSGGVGINLTGADTVFFYDSDWNPSMDRQCMDRAHRIGQTRQVHIYRFVSSHTVEENMLRKAEQKRLLDKMVIQEGGFNNDWWGKVGWKDMFGEVPGAANASTGAEPTEESGIVDVDVEGTPTVDVEHTRPRVGEERDLAKALAEVEDEEDVEAARMAQGEGELDLQEFEEGPKGTVKKARVFEAEKRETPVAVDADGGEGIEEEEEFEDEPEGVETYMLKWVAEDWDFFISYRA